MKRSGVILCLNAGSSSLKYALFRNEDEGIECMRRGIVEEIGSHQVSDHRAAVDIVLIKLSGDLAAERLVGAGHRVVHGGARYTSPVAIDSEVMSYLRDMEHLAPAHQSGAIAGIAALQEIDPHLPQVACFDTAFHQAIPELAQRFPLPEEFWKAGVRRYGFHGLSYEYVLSELKPEIAGKIIIAHLGNGSSLVALRDGQPVETTMGFTPNSGLVMGTRCGDLEPGVLTYLMREKGYSLTDLETLLNKKSGLRGVSGSTSDMRELLDQADNSEYAARALDLFCYSVRKHIGSLVAVLGGLDLLVFTGGIGQNAPQIRERIVGSFRDYLDFEVRVVSTDEEKIVAKHTMSRISVK